MQKDTTFYVGVDEHKGSLVVAACGSEESEVRPAIKLSAGTAKLHKFLGKLSREGNVKVCYEAGPGGFFLQRELEKRGWECYVVAPSLIPRRPGERRKTDRRDAEHLALSFRAGQLSFCHVPTEEQEATRALVRLRESIKGDTKRTQQRTLKFLRTLGLTWSGTKRNWTLAHRKWLRELHLEGPYQEVLGELLGALSYLEDRLASLDKRIREIAIRPEWAERVGWLTCLRGIDVLSAMVLLTEIGDFSRFSSPRQLMAFLGMVPGEQSTGEARRLLSITKAGNSRARRILIEAAHSARHSPVASRDLRARRQGQPAQVVAIAAKASKRLSARKWYLFHRKPRQVAVTAVARELAGFVWAIMRHRELALP